MTRTWQHQPGHVFHEDALAFQLHEQLASTEILEDKIELAIGLKCIDKIHNERILFE